MPSRIQRQRTKGWRAPLCSCGCGKNAIYVGRGSKWGNPYHVNPGLTAQGATGRYRDCLNGDPWPGAWPMPTLEEIRAELKGHDLMCWCPADRPCHAQILLDIANRGAR